MTFIDYSKVDKSVKAWYKIWKDNKGLIVWISFCAICIFAVIAGVYKGIQYEKRMDMCKDYGYINNISIVYLKGYGYCFNNETKKKIEL